MSPRTTILIPCWNAGDHLEPLLRSLLAQRRAPAALVLVDDGSDDGSPARARAVAGDRVRVVEGGERRGLSGNWNRALALADTELLALAHQDDVYDEDWLGVMEDALDAAPEAGFAHCRARAIDDDGRAVDSPVEGYKRRFFADIDHADLGALYRRLYAGNFVCCPSIVYRTALFGRVGPFDDGLRFTADWDLAFRTLLAGVPFVAVDRVLLGYRRHRTSATAAQRHSLNRYEEERATLAEARRRGIEQGFLGPDTGPSPALRNNLLFDAYLDVQEGRRPEARRKLAWGRAELEGFARDPLARGVALALGLGPLGPPLLRLGLWARLRLGPRRVG
ncbi:MAG: glycosyltransferase [Planctomycetota bacterium]